MVGEVLSLKRGFGGCGYGFGRCIGLGGFGGFDGFRGFGGFSGLGGFDGFSGFGKFDGFSGFDRSPRLSLKGSLYHLLCY